MVFITRKFLERADTPFSEVSDALEIGFKKDSNSIIPVIIDSELLNVNNWPCTPFQLHQLPFIDFSTEQKREENFELLKQHIREEITGETEQNLFGI